MSTIGGPGVGEDANLGGVAVSDSLDAVGSEVAGGLALVPRGCSTFSTCDCGEISGAEIVPICII